MSNLTKTIVPVVVLLCIFQVTICTETTVYSKLCTENRKINETVPVLVTQPVRVLKYEWCLSTTSFRCTKYVTEVQTVTRYDTIERSVNVTVCCPGYTDSSDGENCIPMCDSLCKNGVWLSSGECRFEPGYTGTNCSQLCDRNHYGMNCAETCKCQNGGMCHHISGECYCAAGWMGQVCATPIQTEKASTSNILDNTKNLLLFEIEVSSVKLAELSKKLAHGDSVFSVSAKRKPEKQDRTWQDLVS